MSAQVAVQTRTVSAPQIKTVEFDQIQNLISELRSFPESVEQGLMDADPIERAAVIAAQSFVTRYFALITKAGLKWKSPHLSTEGEGGVSLEWIKRDRIFTIFVYPNGTIESLMAWGPRIFEDMEEITSPSDEALLKLWKQHHP